MDIRTVSSRSRKEKIMRKVTLILTLIGAVLLGGLASAQSRAIFEVPNVMAEVTFYDGNPASDGEVLETMRINNSPLARPIENAEDTEYLILNIDDQMYTVKTFGSGADKYSVYLDMNGVAREDALSLGQFLDEVAHDRVALEQVTQLVQN